jgi:formamidopyrimidine-DNA glycosylase
MPELPEVETVVRSLAPHLPGRTILHAEFGSKFVTPGDRKSLAKRIKGRTIRSVRRHGKFILIELDRGVLSVHLGMTGKLLLDGSRGPHSYGIFELDRGTLIYDDPRQFGRIELAENVPERIARLGPEPLTISLEEFTQELRRRKGRLKPLLLNQRFLRGLGNIYADEALFRARLHPLAAASRLSKQRIARLHESIRETLLLAIEHRGSSISDYVDAAGERGWFQLMHQVYGREGQPCSVCGAPIRRTLVGQRGTHYCPRCQRV